MATRTWHGARRGRAAVRVRDAGREPAAARGPWRSASVRPAAARRVGRAGAWGHGCCLAEAVVPRAGKHPHRAHVGEPSQGPTQGRVRATCAAACVGPGRRAARISSEPLPPDPIRANPCWRLPHAKGAACRPVPSEQAASPEAGRRSPRPRHATAAAFSSSSCSLPLTRLIGKPARASSAMQRQHSSDSRLRLLPLQATPRVIRSDAATAAAQPPPKPQRHGGLTSGGPGPGH
jgi:hypothetical protein